MEWILASESRKPELRRAVLVVTKESKVLVGSYIPHDRKYLDLKGRIILEDVVCWADANLPSLNYLEIEVIRAR